jgi:hypothetical protein
MVMVIQKLDTRAARATRIRSVITSTLTGTCFSRTDVMKRLEFLWPKDFDPVFVQEVSSCLNAMLRDEVIRRASVKDPGKKWMEPHYLFTSEDLGTPASRFVKPVPGVPTRRPVKSSECCRCGMKILGKGRHGKSKRGHEKAECDLEMVKVHMTL